MDLSPTRPNKVPRLSLDNSYEESDSNDQSEDESLLLTPSSCHSRPRTSSSGQEEYLPPFLLALKSELMGVDTEEKLGSLYPPSAENAFILYEHDALEKRFSPYSNPDGIVPVVLDPDLAQHLREEQKEGLKFLFDNFRQGQGCILAHLMGAGKTLTSISLIHVLLEQRAEAQRKSKAGIRNVVMVVPKTMVVYWEDEFEKWLVEVAYTKFRPKIVSMSFRSPDEDKDTIQNFLSPDSDAQVLILSYERFTKFQDLFYPNSSSTENLPTGSSGVANLGLDLIIFDEAHALKNSQSQRSIAANSAPFKIKILLTGTPVQNTLEELFRLVEIARPGALLSGTGCESEAEFKKNYITPFSAATLTRNQFQLKPEDLAKLLKLKLIINPTMHIRQNPVTVPRHEIMICLKLVPLQLEMYRNVSQWVKDAANNKANFWYSNITLLRTICSHPSLALKQVKKSTGYTKDYYLPLKNLCEKERVFGTKCEGILSQKMKFIILLVTQLEKKYNAERTQDKSKKLTDKERVVVVSNYTEVLGMVKKFLLLNLGIECLELYGKTDVKKRKENIKLFNDKKKDFPVFLLSLKAGGTGVTLTGANHLVIFDPDWNPANDEQAMARIWRHGQTHPCYIYRLVCAGTIEEVIFKRQLTKKELDRYVTEDDFDKFNTLPEKVRELFDFKSETKSSIHDSMKCTKPLCVAMQGTNQEASGDPHPGSSTSSSGAIGSSSARHTHPAPAPYTFGDYALEDTDSDEQDIDASYMNEEFICDISSLANWDHFQNIEDLPPPGLVEDEIPILRKMWQHDRDKTPLSVGFSFVFYKKVNPISPEIASIRNADDLLEYLVRSPLNQV